MLHRSSVKRKLIFRTNMLWKSISICFEHVSQRFDKTINNKFEMQFKRSGISSRWHGEVIVLNNINIKIFMQDKYTGPHFLAANFYQTRCFNLLKLVTREFKDDSGSYGILLIRCIN